jgi:hypothetical protein
MLEGQRRVGKPMVAHALSGKGGFDDRQVSSTLIATSKEEKDVGNRQNAFQDDVSNS